MKEIFNRFTGKLMLRVKTTFRANLRYADLRYADLQDANLRDANLRYADLRDANLRYADLRYANLRYADLQDANLRYADLRYADLRYADLRYADLRGANLQRANLRRADLDFSCLHLWCGSFDMKVDTRFIWQVIAHLGRFDSSNVSKKAKEALKTLEPYFDEFCRFRSDVSPILKK